MAHRPVQSPEMPRTFRHDRVRSGLLVPHPKGCRLSSRQRQHRRPASFRPVRHAQDQSLAAQRPPHRAWQALQMASRVQAWQRSLQLWAVVARKVRFFLRAWVAPPALARVQAYPCRIPPQSRRPPRQRPPRPHQQLSGPVRPSLQLLCSSLSFQPAYLIPSG